MTVLRAHAARAVAVLCLILLVAAPVVLLERCSR